MAVRETGIRMVVGWPRGGGGSRPQTILFDKNLWSPAEARRWLVKHGFRYDEMEETPSYYRFRQEEPRHFERMRTIALRRSANPGLSRVLDGRYDVEITFRDDRQPQVLRDLTGRAVQIVRRIYESDPSVDRITAKRKGLISGWAT